MYKAMSLDPKYRAWPVDERPIFATLQLPRAHTSQVNPASSSEIGLNEASEPRNDASSGATFGDGSRVVIADDGVVIPVAMEPRPQITDYHGPPLRFHKNRHDFIACLYQQQTSSRAPRAENNTRVLIHASISQPTFVQRDASSCTEARPVDYVTGSARVRLEAYDAIPSPPQQPIIRPQAMPTPPGISEDGLFMLGAAPSDFSGPRVRNSALPPPQNPIAGRVISHDLPIADVKREQAEHKISEDGCRQGEEEEFEADYNRRKEVFSMLAESIAEEKAIFTTHLKASKLQDSRDQSSKAQQQEDAEEIRKVWKRMNLVSNEEALKARNPLPEIPMEPKTWEAMANLLQHIAVPLNNVANALPKWFAVTHDESRARTFLRIRLRLAQQFEDREMTHPKEVFSIRLAEVEDARALIDGIATDLNDRFPWMKYDLYTRLSMDTVQQSFKSQDKDNESQSAPPNILPPRTTEHSEPWMIERKRLRMENLNDKHVQAKQKEQENAAKKETTERADAESVNCRQMGFGSNARLLQRFREIDRKQAALKAAALVRQSPEEADMRAKKDSAARPNKFQDLPSQHRANPEYFANDKSPEQDAFGSMVCKYGTSKPCPFLTVDSPLSRPFQTVRGVSSNGIAPEAVEEEHRIEEKASFFLPFRPRPQPNARIGCYTPLIVAKSPEQEHPPISSNEAVVRSSNIWDASTRIDLSHPGYCFNCTRGNCTKQGRLHSKSEKFSEVHISTLENHPRITNDNGRPTRHVLEPARRTGYSCQQLPVLDYHTILPQDFEQYLCPATDPEFEEQQAMSMQEPTMFQLQDEGSSVSQSNTPVAAKAANSSSPPDHYKVWGQRPTRRVTSKDLFRKTKDRQRATDLAAMRPEYEKGYQNTIQAKTRMSALETNLGEHYKSLGKPEVSSGASEKHRNRDRHAMEDPVQITSPLPSYYEDDGYQAGSDACDEDQEFVPDEDACSSPSFSASSEEYEWGEVNTLVPDNQIDESEAGHAQVEGKGKEKVLPETMSAMKIGHARDVLAKKKSAGSESGYSVVPSDDGEDDSFLDIADLSGPCSEGNTSRREVEEDFEFVDHQSLEE